MAIKKKTPDKVLYDKRCKVCNSEFRNMIENLHVQGMNPRQTLEYLANLSDPEQQEQLLKADLTESAVRRHIQRHFDIKTGTQIKLAEGKTKLQRSRDQYKKGVRVMIDNVALISHMIDALLIQMEELDNLPEPRQRHQLTLNYAAQIKSLVESLGKLTGELKQEGSIDINFFSNQVERFAEIVISTIKALDIEFGLSNELEYRFANEFKKQFELYKVRQNKMLNGELSLDYDSKEKGVNRFNDKNE